MFISELVIEEAGKGNTDSAARRLEAVKGIPLLKVTEGAVRLAKKMIAAALLPVNATADALHISLAAEH